MPRVTRINLAGGVIGKSLHTRSDLQQYHKGNFQQTNFLATPQGGIKRRPPAAWLGYIPNKNDIPPSVVRGFKFVVSDTEKYSVLLCDFGGNTSFEIYGDDGTYKTSVASPYASADLFDIDVLQVNDVMIMTHQSYPPADLIRQGDELWSYVERDIIGGPFLDQNDDRDLVMSTGLSHWYSDINYLEGDWVLPEQSVALQANWIGTLISHAQDPVLSLEHDFSSDDPYYSPRSVWYFEGRSFTNITDKEFPCILVRIDDPVDAAETVGAVVSINAEFVEDGNDETYRATGEIIEVVDKTTYHYLKLDTGASVLFEYRSVLSSTSVTGQTFSGVPDAELKSGADGEYDGTTFRTYTAPSPDAILKYTAFTGTNRRVHNLIYGSASFGGAYVVAANNVIIGSTAAFYQANEDNFNSAPPTDPPWDTSGTQPYDSKIQQLKTDVFDPFTEDDLGRQIALVSTLSASYNDSFTSLDETSDSYSTTGEVTLTTEGGTWEGNLVLESKPVDEDDTYWEEIGSITSNGDYNGTITRYISEIGIEIRVRMENYVSGTCKWTLDIPNGDTAFYKVLKVISTRSVVVRVLSGDDRFISNYRWQLGAFGGDQGYPAVNAIHEERLYFGSTVGRPFQAWGSEVNNWTNFTLGTLETSPVSFRLLSDNITQMKWMLSRSSQLYIGTDFGEYVLTTPDKDTVISGTNPPRVTLVTPFGSDLQQAVAVDDEIFHVTGDQLTMRAITEKEYTTQETSKVLTIFNPDISDSGIKEIHLQRNPYPIIWALRNDGTIAAFTYDLMNDVMGWAEIELTGSDIKSHWVIPNEDNLDEIYFVDERDDVRVNVSGITNPTEANGDYANSGSQSIHLGMTVTGSPGGVGDGYYNFQGGPEFKFYNETDGVTYRWNSDEERWAFSVDVSGPLLDIYWNTSDDGLIPPKGDYVRNMGTTDIEIDYEFYMKKDPYGIAVGRDGISHIFGIDNELLFNSNAFDETIEGEYSPVSPSTGTAVVTPFSFNIEKFRYGAVESDLNEQDYESIVELSSLIQGPETLERTKVKASRIIIHLVESFGGEVSADGGETWEPIIYDDELAFTGHKDIRVNSGNVEDLRILARATGTDPFHVIGIAVDIEKQGTEAGR